LRARAFLILLLSSPAFAAPIPVGGQVSPVVKDARALLIPLVSEIEAGRLELEGKADPEPVASAAVAADGSFRLEAPEPGMYRVMVQAPGFVPREKQLAPLLEETDLPAVELEKDVRVEVRVTGADGKPVQGARVRIGDPPGSGSWDMDDGEWQAPPRSGLTDAQGKLVLAREPSEGLVVRAGAPGLPFVEKRDVRTSTVSLTLPQGSTRELRVLDAAGKPVPGALVRLGEARWTAGRTGADGVLPVPLAGKLKLQVLAIAEDGRSASLYLEPKKPEETGPRDLRLPASETLSGRVVSTATGLPVSGALVWARDPGAFRRTGADGGYKMSAVSGRELSVAAAAAGFYKGRSNWAVKAGERRAPTLALEPAFTAAGVVVDDQGKPVAGVEIKAIIHPGARAMDRWDSGGSARTTAAGRFRIPRLAGGVAHQLRLTRKGYAPATADVPPAEPGSPSSELRIVLRKGRTASGRVVDSADKPVARAWVVLEPEPSGGMMIRMMSGSDDSGRFEAVADASGRFELPDVPAGTFQLLAGGSGYAPITVPGLAVPEGSGATDLGTVVLVRGVALEGYVTDPKGRPVEGARISVEESGANPMMSRPRPPEESPVLTAADGFFRIADRRAGELLDVEARRAGYAKGSAPGVQVPSEQPVRIVLQPSSAVEGRAADSDGKPVAGAQILLIADAPAGLGRGFVMFSSDSVKETRSGDEGSFRIEDVAPGTYQLKAMASGRQAADRGGLEVRSGQDLTGVEIVLTSGGIVEGRVLSSGRPVAGARIEMAEPSALGTSRMLIRAGTSSDGDGYYRLDGVAPGSRTFKAQREGFSTAVRDLEVRPGENALDFAMEEGVEVSGRVVDDGGVPVPAARVFLSEGWNWNLPSAVTRPDGSFTLSGVPDGTYRIGAEKEGYARSEGENLTVSSNVSGVEVRLSTGGAIVGRLSGLDFAELSQVRVWADADEFRPGRVLPDSSYRLENVEPGEHRVYASLRGERQTEGRVTLEPGEPEVRLDLEFGEGYLLTGRVLRNGEAVPGGNVALGGPGVAGRPWAKTDHEGRFRYEGLEAGTYDLTVIDSRGQSSHKKTVELTRDLDVELELVAVTLTGRVVDSSDKQPLSGARVKLLPPRGGEVGGGSFFKPDVVTDSRGVFRLSDVPGGSWRVQAVLDGYSPGEQSIEVDAGSAAAELEFALQATEGVTLQVVLASGRPPNYVRAAVLDPAGQVIAQSTYPAGEEGRLRLAIVPAGSWDLVLDADGSAPVTLPVTSPGQAGRVVLPLPGVLDLKVPALQDARVGARLTLTDQNGKPFRTAYGESLTSFDLEAGALKLQRLSPGTWKLDVKADDGRTWSGTATIVPGGTVTMTLD
jgi:protocatechuate 3,4-dioxygenase beta subunit